MPLTRKLCWSLPLLLLLTLTPTVAAAQCGCKDLEDLKLRREEVFTAQQAFASRIRLTERTPYTVRDKNFHKAEVQKILDALATQKGRSTHATGETSNVGVINIKAPTDCLRESIRQHEMVHQQAAFDDLQASLGNMWGDADGDRFAWKKATMADYLREEVRGYAQEIQFIDREVARLLKECGQKPPLKRDGTSYISPGPPSGPGAEPPPPPSSGPRPMAKPAPLAKPAPIPKPKPIFE